MQLRSVAAGGHRHDPRPPTLRQRDSGHVPNLAPQVDAFSRRIARAMRCPAAVAERPSAGAMRSVRSAYAVFPGRVRTPP
jgi:hypothetical protein